MSLSIQAQISQQIAQIDTEAQLAWEQFAEQVAGDIESLCSYLPIIKSAPGMDCPQDLAVQFATICGQFSRSESKMIEMLTESNFSEDQDYCQIDTDEAGLQESKLFISYNCLKMFIVDRADIQMIRAMTFGELLYNQYKRYSKSFTKSPAIKHTYMIIEQKQFASKGSLAIAVANFGNPSVVLRIVVTTEPAMAKLLEQIEASPGMFGDMIVPPTQSIFENAADDVSRILNHVKRTITKPYQEGVRAKCKASKDKNDKAPTRVTDWGFCVTASAIIVSADVKNLPFTHKDVAKSIKAFFIGMLAQQHVSVDKLSHKDYLNCVEEWSAKRVERSAYFSAVKANAIHTNAITRVKKDAERKERVEKKGSKKDAPYQITMAVVTNGYETAGSDDEKPAPKKDAKQPKAESDDDETPKPKKASKKVTKKDKVESDDDETPKSKKAPKKVAKKEKAESDDEAPKPKKASKKGKVELTPAKKSAKPVAEDLPCSDSDADDLEDLDDLANQISDDDEA